MMMLNKQRGGLKALSKEKRERLEAYQHLFYLLQVRKKAPPPPPRPAHRLGLGSGARKNSSRKGSPGMGREAVHWQCGNAHSSRMSSHQYGTIRKKNAIEEM